MSIEKLNECIKIKRANHSRAREALYEILLNSDECLNVSEITKKLSQNYPKKISLNSLYRHLNFFIDCELVVAIQDNHKRAYYHLKDSNLMTFCICTKCSSVFKVNSQNIIPYIKNIDAEFITIHKICNKCNTNSN
nr:transcriptional repressor [uncultured Sulfurimonas sp.]